jgi:SAM-dependent methyltransferase
MNAFNSLYADQYDQLYTEKNYNSECDLVEEAFRLLTSKAPTTLLDVGCGTGGHAIELASRGYEVTGIDLSQAMLDLAVGKAAALSDNNRPAFLQGDARDFNTGQSYDAAIMMFAVVGYLTSNDDVLSGLRNIRKQLKIGAPFLCDFWYGPSVLSVRPTDRIREIPTKGGRVIRAASTTLDILHHTADVTFKLWTLDGDRLISETHETHRMRYFFPQEFTLFLKSAGFQLKTMTAFPSLSTQLSEQSWNALAVAIAVN